MENAFTLAIRLLPSPRPLFAPKRSGVVADDHTLHFSEKRVIVIGRGLAADVKVDHGSVDDIHAIISRERGFFEITDRGSKRGTLVGGIPLVPSEPRLLPSHAIVQVGEVRVEVAYGESPYETYARVGAPDVARAALLREQVERENYPLRLVIVEGGLSTRDRIELPPRLRPYGIGASRLCECRLDGEGIPEEAVRLVVTAERVVVTNANATPIRLGPRTLKRGEEAEWSTLEMLGFGNLVFALEDPIRMALANYEQQLRGLPVGRRRLEEPEDGGFSRVSFIEVQVTLSDGSIATRRAPSPSVTIGRDFADGLEKLFNIEINDSHISREHAELEVKADGSLSVTDLGSRNGTAVGTRLLAPGECADLAPDGGFVIGGLEAVARVVQVDMERPSRVRPALPITPR